LLTGVSDGNILDLILIAQTEYILSSLL